MRRRHSRIVVIVIGLVVGGVGLSDAQTEKGSITGVVQDSSGGVLPGATVTVTNLGTQLSAEYVSNDAGRYEAPFLTPGRYRIAASLAGFATAIIEEVELNVGGRATANLTLPPASVTTDVTVRAQPTLVQTETATIGQVVDAARLTQLPTLDRNIYDFMLLTSNVTGPPGGNAPAFRLESGGSFAISGTRPSSITFRIDGLSNTDPGFGTPTITPMLDSVQEFQVHNNAYSAEYEGIGQVNVATKSGTSQYHGAFTEFYRSEDLQPTHPLLDEKTPLNFDQFGGTLGGPVPFSGRTFFFFAYEGRRHDNLNIGRTAVPTDAERSGDFSASLGGCLVSDGQTVPLLGSDGQPTGGCVREGQIFNPFTTSANPSFDPGQPASAFNPQLIRQPFPGNAIPSSLVGSTAQALFEAQVPLPNQNQLGDDLSNYQGLTGADINYDQWSVRVDHNLTDSDRVYGRVAIQDNVRMNQPLVPFTTKNLQGKGRVASGTWARVLGANAVNELRVGYVRGIYGDFIDEIDPSQFGIENTTLPTLPRFFLSGAALSYGGFSGSVLNETQDTFQVADNFSWLRGKHALKAGFELSYNTFHNAERFGANGTANVTGLYTVAYNAGMTAGRAHSLADFVLGLAESTSLNRPAQVEVQNMPWAVYVQDDWNLNDRITISAGLRYEYHHPWKEENLGGAALDLSNGGQLFVVDPEVATLSDTPLVVCCAPRRAVEADRNDFAPRVSAVYRPFASDELAIRAGYGLYYSDTTQFFTWRSYEPLRGAIYDGVAGDFRNPGSRLENLFPVSSFVQGGGVEPFFPSGVAGLTTPVISAGGVLASHLNRTPMSHQWSVSVQREILPRMLLDVTYQGSIGRNLPTQWIFNQPPPSPVPVDFSSTDAAANPYLRRPYECCSTGSFFYNGNIEESQYNALTIKVDKRFANDYQFLASYTYSASYDHGSDVFAVGNTFNILSNSRDIEQDWGRSSYDVPHRVVASGSVILPFGQGRRFLDQGGVVNALVGGWRASTNVVIQSGFPFTPLIRNRRANTGYALSTERGDLIGNPYWSDDEWNRLVDEWKRADDTRLFIINPDAISLDYAPGTFGSIPRNFFRAPYGYRLDLSFAKVSDLPGRVQLEVRADIINATGERLHRLDLSQLVRANNLLTHPTMGSVGTYNELFNPRVIQLGMRLTF